MRDHDHVDRLGIEARRRHILGEQPVRALAVDLHSRAKAGIDHDQLAAGIDHERREVNRHRFARHERLLERSANLFFLRVEDEVVSSGNVYLPSETTVTSMSPTL
jgi:hypothetical protein